jgi:hypothetical protein
VLTGGLNALVALAGAAFAAQLEGLLDQPANAQTGTDIPFGQTAAAIEHVALGLYIQAGEHPALKDLADPARGTLTALMVAAAAHHLDHARAFNAAVLALGGQQQLGSDGPLADSLVTPGLAAAQTPTDVVRLVARFEQVAAETYALATIATRDRLMHNTFAATVGVEAQHQGVLLAVAELLSGHQERLVVIPTQLGALPAAVGSSAAPDPRLPLKDARSPTEGAVH